MGRDIHTDIHKNFRNIMKLHFLICHNHFEKLGIFPSQAFVLRCLKNRDGQSQKDLCKNLHVRPSTVTVMIKRMEKRGLIKRVQDEKDKRITRIYLCKIGMDMIEDISKTQDDLEKITFKNLSDEEVNELNRLLVKIRDNLREEYPHNIECFKVHNMFEEMNK